jgi:hypothetical protein
MLDHLQLLHALFTTELVLYYCTDAMLDHLQLLHALFTTELVLYY